MASIESPEKVLDALRNLLKAGADGISTNTFGATPAVMAANGLGKNLSELAFEVNFRSASLARTAAREFSSSTRSRWVLGSIGPTLHALSIMGGGEDKFLQLKSEYYEQARALQEGGVDILHVERCQDRQNVTAALLAIEELQKAKGSWIPTMLTAELDCGSKMIDGTSPTDLSRVRPDLKLLAVGLTGPTDNLIPAIPELLKTSQERLAVLPDTFGFHSPDHWFETPESLAEQIRRICINDRVGIVGVGRGARPHFISSVAKVVNGEGSAHEADDSSAN
jgi:5-methyltetrahydrofolate--homocysteine methyltransferase